MHWKKQSRNTAHTHRVDVTLVTIASVWEGHGVDRVEFTHKWSESLYIAR